MNENEFQKKVLDGVESLQTEQKTIATKQQQLLTDFDRLDKDTKSAFEDLTKAKNAINDITGTLTALQKVQIALQREQRMAFGDPRQRIRASEEKRAFFNAAVRAAMRVKLGDSLQKALGEDSSPGSIMIRDDLAMDIFDALERYGKWSTLGVRRLGTKITKLPIKTARPIANFILTEGNQIADDTNKAGSSVNLEVEVIAVLLNVSLQLLEDSEYDLTADVLDDFLEAYAYRLDYAAFVADGTADATNGGMTGVFGFGTAAVAAATHTSVGALDLADFIKPLTTVDSVALTRGAKWWLHQQMLARVGGIKDGNGRPLFQTALEAPSPGSIGSLNGFPVELTAVAPNTDGVSKSVAAFGDPQAYAVGVRRDFVFEASDQHKWDSLQRSFRGWGRAGTKGRRAGSLAILKTAAA